jgi:nitroimidazol reductase NimA-like FMN-containing flavoprotein (pyridoxamine 5'-phosphate oxidase superfamily)
MTPAVGQQRRGRKIAMTTAELDGFLAGQRTCRVATVGARGPHLTPAVVRLGRDGTVVDVRGGQPAMG